MNNASERDVRRILERAFVPRIQIDADEEVTTLVQSLDHKSLAEMLNSYSQIGDVTVRHANSMSHVASNFVIEFLAEETPEYTAAPDDFEGILADILSDTSRTEVNGVFEEWLSSIVSPTDKPPFETLNHPVASVLAVSSKTQDPIEAFRRMIEKSCAPESITPYISNDYLRILLFVHDEDTLAERATLEFEKIKQEFGSCCFKLSLGTSNHVVNDENISQAVKDITLTAVVPFMEECLRIWNEQVNSSRQGLASRLFTVSKRYLNTPVKLNKNVLRIAAQNITKKTSNAQDPIAPPGTTRGNYYVDDRYYFYASSEAQLRKLADFAVMLRDYKTAFSILDALKKDFLSDKAWGYLAAAQEMAAVVYLASRTSMLSLKSFTNTIEPLLDSAVYSYISRCHLPGRALRAILSTVELIASSECEPLVASQAATWLLKVDTESLVGGAGVVMIRQRIANLYVQQNRQYPDSSRRKVAFWNLFAAQSLRSYSDSPLCFAELKQCVETANNYSYSSIEWPHEEGTLLSELEKLALEAKV